MSSIRRIAKEFEQLNQSPPPGLSVSLGPQESLHTWHVTLLAPADTVYHPGRYGIIIALPAEYPFRPPTVRFVTPIHHPNVLSSDDTAASSSSSASPSGAVCLACLKPDRWKPSTRLVAVLDALVGLLRAPDPDDPLDDGVAEQFRFDRKAFDAAARAAVHKYALKEPVFPALTTEPTTTTAAAAAESASGAAGSAAAAATAKTAR